MYNVQFLEARVQCFNAKVIARTNKGIRILDNVYLEATVPITKFYEPPVCEWHIGEWIPEFEIHIEDIDQDYAEHDEYIIKEVIKLIDFDNWEIIDEWERPPCWEDC